LLKATEIDTRTRVLDVAFEAEIRRLELKRECYLQLLLVYESGDAPPFCGTVKSPDEDPLISGWEKAARMVVLIDLKLQALKMRKIWPSSSRDEIEEF
jgi:hypothetical protein